LVEHTAENRGVAGSIPALATSVHAVFRAPQPSSRPIASRLASRGSEPLSLGTLGLVQAMPADEPALVAGIRERLKPAFEGLERGVTEQNPLSVPAHWALPILVCHCLAHPPSVGEHPGPNLRELPVERNHSGAALSRRRRRIQGIGSKGFVKTATGGRGVWYDCAP
jgi:hypothetical protein